MTFIYLWQLDTGKHFNERQVLFLSISLEMRIMLWDLTFLRWQLWILLFSGGVTPCSLVYNSILNVAYFQDGSRFLRNVGTFLWIWTESKYSNLQIN
jgi:hypothetical protein